MFLKSESELADRLVRLTASSFSSSAANATPSYKNSGSKITASNLDDDIIDHDFLEKLAKDAGGQLLDESTSPIYESPHLSVPTGLSRMESKFIDFTDALLTSTSSLVSGSHLHLGGEEVDRIVAQVQDQVHLERKYGDAQATASSSLEDRIKKLAQDPPKMVTHSSAPPLTLGSVPKPPDDLLVKRHIDDDPDSWCCICNENATMMCLECDDDKYCDKCCREHLREELDHKPRRFVR